MSLRSGIVLSHAAHAAHAARSSSLVPFLYHTQTLLSLPSFNPTKSCRPNCKNHRDYTSTHQERNGAYKSWRPDSDAFGSNVFARPQPKPPTDSDVPFEDVEPQSEAEPPKKSTMTASEKAVFDRILNDIDQSLSEKEEEDSQNGDMHDAEVNPYEDLNSIFDAAIQQLRLREEQVAKSVIKQQSRRSRVYERALDEVVALKDLPLGARSFIRPIKLDNGVVLGAETHTEEGEEALKVACNNHRTRVSGMLERANSDVQIWGVLEKEVFRLIKQLDAQIKLEGKSRKMQERGRKKAAKERKSQSESDQDHLRETPSNTASSVAVPTNVLFSILQTNYGDYCLSALRLLRRYHPTSFYALHLLPTMKRLGPISYVLGASTSIYNEVLFLKWTQFSDLYGMADLMQEMIDQGIEINEVTMVFIRRLSSKRKHGRMGRYGPILQKWWEMRGNLEGWRRVCQIYESVKRMEMERKEKEALEKGRVYEEEGKVEDDG